MCHRREEKRREENRREEKRKYEWVLFAHSLIKMCVRVVNSLNYKNYFKKMMGMRNVKRNEVSSMWRAFFSLEDFSRRIYNWIVKHWQTSVGRKRKKRFRRKERKDGIVSCVDRRYTIRWSSSAPLFVEMIDDDWNALFHWFYFEKHCFYRIYVVSLNEIRKQRKGFYFEFSHLQRRESGRHFAERHLTSLWQLKHPGGLESLSGSGF